MPTASLRNVDLNLLVILDALLRCGSVTAAARRLSLSQPAVSHALGRLRTLFGDQLLVRGSGGMVATPLGDALRQPVGQAILDLARIVRCDHTFDPMTSQRTFMLATPDIAELTALPRILQALIAAPGVEVAVCPVAARWEDDLATGALDLAVGPMTEPPTQFKVGFPDELAPGQVETKYKAQFGVWIVRDQYDGIPQVFALQSVCTHLGCTPNWLEGEQKFKCPCHGSGFYKDGINFEGPAPRPLERFAIRLGDDGQLEVDKSRKFKEEVGQWKDPSSFVPV